jgi:UDP-glucuronate decarboxylase
VSKILITGGAGFLGSHLAQLYINKGSHVTVLDDLSTGSKSNLVNISDHPKFKLIEADVRDPINVQADIIFNFACPASPVHYQHDPVKTMETNLLGMSNVLKLALANNSRVVQASTSEVYGDPHESPQTETYWGNVNPIGIRSCYDEGKRGAETLCYDYRRQHGLDIRVVRIFNTYGPNMAVNDGRVVSNFIVQALTSQKISLYGDGKQTRSFCYVQDLIKAIDSVANTSYAIESPINIGNPKEMTIKELAETVVGLIGSDSVIEYLPLPADDPKQRQPDISRARKLLDWEPRISLEDGLKATIEYFKEKV